jgi:hypothetical protein
MNNNPPASKRLQKFRFFRSSQLPPYFGFFHFWVWELLVFSRNFRVTFQQHEDQEATFRSTLKDTKLVNFVMSLPANQTHLHSTMMLLQLDSVS